MLKPVSNYAELAALSVDAALKAIRLAGKHAYDETPAATFSIGKSTDTHLFGDVTSELAMFNVVSEWGKSNKCFVYWWSEELGKIRCGDLDSPLGSITVTADGIDGTNPFKQHDEAGPIITIASGSTPNYRDILASAIGLIYEDKIIVADVMFGLAYDYRNGEYTEFTTPRRELDAKLCWVDTYTAVAKIHAKDKVSSFLTTGSTAYTIYLVARCGHALLLDATDKLMFEQHAMFAFAKALGLILETFNDLLGFDSHSMLGWQMNPDPESPDQLAFYFVPRASFKTQAIRLFG